MSSPLKKPRLLVSSLLIMSTSAIMKSSQVLSTSTFPAGIKFIGTHNGSFHCDEALAIGMLKILPEYENLDIIRTRDPELLKNCAIVVDVGAVYDAATNRFDHHQREFTGMFDGFKTTKLSSAGLVYKHFGESILRALLADEPALTDAFFAVAYRKLYKDFVEHIDAIDNGVSVSEGENRYHISTTLSSRVGGLNPAWNEPQSSEDLNERFRAAVEMTHAEFVSHARGLARSWWPARTIVQRALDGRFAVHASGKVMILDTACPWKDHLFDLEEADKQQVLYALYADMGGGWRVQAVPVDANSFTSRKTLPTVWHGLRDAALSAKCGIAGCVFIHANGFIGGHADREGAIAMAIMALDLD